MGWLGHGLPSSSRIPFALHETFAPVLIPGQNWNGTQGSGFTSRPTDPERITAKPACRLITPPRQWFTDVLLVGVDAWANNQGTLINGVEKVVFHFEGGSAEISSPSFQSFPDANGNMVTYFGWWVRLGKPAGRAGFGDLYVEAVPTDPSMQSRVIGPYLFCPQEQKHDGQLAVAASGGGDFATIDAATNYAKAQGWQNPLITITEAGQYPMSADNNPTYSDQKGHMNITASVPDASIVTAPDKTRIFHNKSRLHFFGANLTIDMNQVIEISGSDGGDNNGLHWLDGVQFTSTHPNKQFELYKGKKIDEFGWRVEKKAWFTECTISNLAGSTGAASLVRGCTYRDITYDIVSDASCVIDNRITNHTDSFWREDHEVFTVSYTGSEPTATLERTGGASGNDIFWYATWGSNQEVFHTGSDNSFFEGTQGDGYDVQDVVDWLNSLPGWTAVISDPDHAGYIAGRVSASTGAASAGFGPTSVKDVVHQFYIQWARHSDFYQHGVGRKESVIVRGNIVDEGSVQAIFIGPINNGFSADFAILNNIFNVVDSSDSLSQIGKKDVTASHVVLAHNTWVDQRVGVRLDSQNMDIDAYSLISNNTMEGMTYFGGTADPDFAPTDNHFHAGNFGTTDAVRSSTGGDRTTLFADAQNGDFAPAGDLLANPATPIVAHDVVGNPRGIYDAKGAVAAVGMELEPAPAPTPVNTDRSSLIAFAAEAIAAWDHSDPTTISAGDGGSVVQGDGDTIARIPNFADPDRLHLVQPDNALQPVYNNGPQFTSSSGHRFNMELAQPLPVNAGLTFVYFGTSTNWSAFSDPDGNDNKDTAPLVQQNTSSAVGNSNLISQLWIDGVEQSALTRSQFRAAIANAAPHVITMFGDLSTIANALVWGRRMNNGRNDFNVGGRLLPIGIWNADTADARSLAETEAERQIAALGLGA